MKKEEIVRRLEELMEPDRIDPYYSDDDMFFQTQIGSLLEDIERDEGTL
jgi:hypothetical protein